MEPVIRTRVILVERSGHKKKVHVESSLLQSLDQLKAFLAGGGADATRLDLLKWEYFDSNDFHEHIDLDEESFADAISIERLKVRISSGDGADAVSAAHNGALRELVQQVRSAQDIFEAEAQLREGLRSFSSAAASSRSQSAQMAPPAHVEEDVPPSLFAVAPVAFLNLQESTSKKTSSADYHYNRTVAQRSVLQWDKLQAGRDISKCTQKSEDLSVEDWGNYNGWSTPFIETGTSPRSPTKELKSGALVSSYASRCDLQGTMNKV
jgi:hypothetical protein